MLKCFYHIINIDVHLLYCSNTGVIEINVDANADSEAVYEDPAAYEEPVTSFSIHTQRLPNRDSDIACKLDDCPAYGVV